MRGAWIETVQSASFAAVVGRPSCEGRGLKHAHSGAVERETSPLMRGAWIETVLQALSASGKGSPLMRGAWIETLVL